MVWTVSKYPVWMTQKPQKGDFGELKSKKYPRGPCPLISLEVGIRSVFTLDLQLRRTVTNPAHQENVFGLIKMTLSLVCVSFSLPKCLSFKTGFLCTLGLQLLKTHRCNLSRAPSPLQDITFFTLHQLSAQGNDFVSSFVYFFAPGFKGSTGSVVQEKNTEDKLTQVRFVAVFNAVVYE